MRYELIITRFGMRGTENLHSLCKKSAGAVSCCGDFMTMQVRQPGLFLAAYAGVFGQGVLLCQGRCRTALLLRQRLGPTVQGWGGVGKIPRLWSVGRIATVDGSFLSRSNSLIFAIPSPTPN